MIIMDLDNCISDDSWRLKYIDWDEPCMRKRFHQYHLRLSQDAFVSNSFIKEGPIIVTSRPYVYYRETKYWLDYHGVKYRDILMRTINCYEPSRVLKRKIAAQLKGVTLAVDDRDDVLQAYQYLGIKTERIAIHEAR